MNRLVWIVLAIGCSRPAAPTTSSGPRPPRPAAARALAFDAVRPPRAGGATPAPILDLLSGELTRSMTALKQHADPPYFASYEVTDHEAVSLSTSNGVLERRSESRSRTLDIDVRVGDYKLDNTHRVGTRGRPDRGRGNTATTELPLDDDPYAVRSIAWLRTDAAYKRAAESLTRVRAQTRVSVKEDDESDDFSREPAAEYFEAPAKLAIDRVAWEARLRALSRPFVDKPAILYSGVDLVADATTRYFTSTEGTRYQVARTHARITVHASTRADDGMQLSRNETFDVATPDRLPDDAAIKAKVDLVITDILALRAAPIADPYSGPAILEGKAAGVFFHEVFGHRVEGHRQKDETEGQTFAKKVGQAIAPPFMTVYDDPTIARLNGVDLNGFYRFDNEGTAAQQAMLLESGVLKTFLLGRSPTRGFTRSNGHGRRQRGYSVVARQGNLVIAPKQVVDREALTRLLLDEVRRQGKPYGLVIREISGGHTTTGRFSAQAFKLLPIMVYRVYLDGREELVRGADLEGTPLAALADIRAAADDVNTFNGYCGAESGSVPVSASSPSLLVGRIEVTKRPKSSEKPPILPSPPRTLPAGGGK